MSEAVTDEEYRELLRSRDALRRFLRWSGEGARAAGLTPSQHQLLLAIRGNGNPSGPTIAQAAAHLLLRHHSAVELVDRAVGAGVIIRRRDSGDGRAVRLALTPLGEARLEALTQPHLDELRWFAALLGPIWHEPGAPADAVLARATE